MLARSVSATPWGVDARIVDVEVDARNGLPAMFLVGLPDASVRESRERVRAAIVNSGFELKPQVVVINLAPADLRKEGNHLDLAIALALLSAVGHLSPAVFDGRLICGELGLDGGVRPVRGGLALADLARREGLRELLLPAENAAEAAALDAVPVLPVRSLREAVAHLRSERPIQPARAGAGPVPSDAGAQPDLAEVRGQAGAKRALEVAAAGGHNLLLIGPPGAGKTMLARRLPGILPSLTLAESIAVTKIHALVAEAPASSLVATRPFRAPHAGVSAAGMVGGGSVPRPGEASLAHAGVLFLDELPEFARAALEALRQPLEEGQITVVRTRARFVFPARFALLAAMNPCPCGHLGDPRQSCSCTPQQIARYRGRVSGPLLDRIDLHVDVPAVSLSALRAGPGEPSDAVAARVAAARERQRARFDARFDTPVNAALDSEGIDRHCRLDASAQRLLDAAFDRLNLSARALTRILKVGRTIADLAGSDAIAADHVAEAIHYRSLDRRVDEW
ncbi:MAG: YifB family Mg chelatase-like AAA ATPase [Acidobacteriota bacterium]